MNPSVDVPVLRFLGATGTVTGSKYLLEARGRKIMIDCGLFQGYKQIRERNWKPLAIDPAAPAAGVELHAHLGDRLEKGQPLYTIHAETRGELEYAREFAGNNGDIIRLDPES